jgi:hypothetical protein
VVEKRRGNNPFEKNPYREKSDGIKEKNKQFFGKGGE